MAIAEEVQTVPVRSIPFPMGDPYRIPPQRYFDRDFFELEKKHLWPRVWQMACRLEEIPDRGRLRRIRDLRPVDPGGAPSGYVGQGVLQRLPAPGHRTVQGIRPPARRPDRLPVPRLAVEHRRQQLVRLRPGRASTPSASTPTDIAPAGMPGRDLGRRVSGSTWIPKPGPFRRHVPGGPMLDRSGSTT